VLYPSDLCSLKIIKTIMKKYKEALEERDVKLEDRQVQSTISKAKSKGQTASDLRERNRVTFVNGTSSIAAFLDTIVVEVYEIYEKTLKDNNALDFDDLLLYGSRLFGENKKAVGWCKYVLVDEL
jgi:DNA helicase II / ATP-dependent DNA helicase PcrA